jgi:hypothetical protein
VVVASVAAAVTLGAGAAIAQVVGDDPQPPPVAERSLMAAWGSGSTVSTLSAYQAQVTRPDGESSVAWCLVLDAPELTDPGSSGGQHANLCRSADEPAGNPIGEHALFPGLAGDQGQLFGWVSPEVQRLQMTTADGVTRDLNLTAPPEDLGIGGAYFAAPVPSGTVQLVAFTSSGTQLQILTLGGPEAR